MDNSELDPLDRIEVAAFAAFRRYKLDSDGWRFEFDGALNRYGICRHAERLISMSRALVTMNTLSQSLDILLHEVAHALAGPSHGHDATWRVIASKIGARPERCYDTCNPEVVRPEGRFTASCPCGARHARHRLPRPGRRYFCRLCKHPLTWSPK